IGYRESTVQVPPRGVWGRSGAATLALGEAWLGGTIAPNAAPDELVRRYLGAFGPATINDAQSWSGMTHLRDVFEQLRPTLVEFRDTADRTLFDLPEAPRPAEDSPAPPRYLPEYDNLLLGHVDRTRVIDKQHKTTLYPGNGARLGAVLLGGRYAGGWKIVEPTSEARLEVQLLAKPSQSDRDGLVEEGLGLLAFAAPASAGRDISITVAA
ncbi:MAG: DNA glycosylase AlkZ-like family protein, partial [Candidatus Limnocylindrales bacterium]